MPLPSAPCTLSVIRKHRCFYVNAPLADVQLRLFEVVSITWRKTSPFVPTISTECSLSVGIGYAMRSGFFCISCNTVFTTELIRGIVMKHGSFTRKSNASVRALSMTIATLLMGASPLLVTTPAHAGISIGIGITVNAAPPPLPVYVQPPIPAVGYIWVPGYWAYADGGYYWVPGTWVEPPFTGALWTPGYWGWFNGVYAFHEGYWGTQVGFYGGINYGYGYNGDGYVGGHWGPGGFYYNRSVNELGGVHVTNVYNQTIVNNVTVNHVSYNGGQGGVAAQPTPQQQAFAQQQHTPPVAAQQQHVAMARENPALREANNHGNPSIAATSTPGHFSGAGVVAAHGAPPAPAAHLPPQHPATPAENGAMRSTQFAPHSNPEPAPAEHPPQAAGRTPAEAPMNRPAPEPRPENRPMSAPEQSPHPAPAYHAPAQPAFHPAAPPHPAAAPHPGAAPHPAAKPQHEQHPKNEQDHGG
jgi:hypothetical protein